MPVNRTVLGLFFSNFVFSYIFQVHFPVFFALSMRSRAIVVIWVTFILPFHLVRNLLFGVDRQYRKQLFIRPRLLHLCKGF